MLIHVVVDPAQPWLTNGGQPCQRAEERSRVGPKAPIGPHRRWVVAQDSVGQTTGRGTPRPFAGERKYVAGVLVGKTVRAFSASLRRSLILKALATRPILRT